MAHFLRENELHRKQGFRDHSSPLDPILQKTVSRVSRYQPGSKATKGTPSAETSPEAPLPDSIRLRVEPIV